MEKPHTNGGDRKRFQLLKKLTSYPDIAKRRSTN